MARLADSVNATDSVEAVRRRYLRQNRELARVNSTYSTRITSLEAKVTELVAENLTLRQQLIALQHGRRREWLNRQCRRVGGELRRKLQEIGQIVDEFEALDREPSPISLEIPVEVDKVGTLEESSNQKEDLANEVEFVSESLPIRQNDSEEDELEQISALQDEEIPMTICEPDSQVTALLTEATEITETTAAAAAAATDTETGNIIEPTMRSRRKRRDSSSKSDFISMIKDQSENYKLKMSSQQDSGQATTNSPPKHVGIDTTESEPEQVIIEPIIPTVDQARKRSSRRRSSMLLPKVAVETIVDKTGNVGCIIERENIEVNDEVIACVSQKGITHNLNVEQDIKDSEEFECQIPKNGDNESTEPVNTGTTQNAKMFEHTADAKVEDTSNTESVDSVPARPALQQKNVNTQSSRTPTIKKSDKKPKPKSKEIAMAAQIDESEDLGRRSTRRARSSVNYALPSLRVKMRRDSEQLVDAVRDERRTSLEIHVKREPCEEEAVFAFPDERAEPVLTDMAMEGWNKRKRRTSVVKERIDGNPGRLAERASRIKEMPMEATVEESKEDSDQVDKIAVAASRIRSTGVKRRRSAAV
ncbi:uncharacterized protein V1516DRAFT_687170 [Lipomyces oligophaga]|uniref:uncharacterized protein n=1 Tax=Lipomyces oligophaga TaxID=45792 RepID=UPI0034CD0707